MVPAINLEDAFCAIQASIYNGQLLEAMIAAGSDLYKSINIEFSSASGCTSCVCPEPSGIVVPNEVCTNGYTPSAPNQCSTSATCPSGTSLEVEGCRNDTANSFISLPICPSGSVFFNRTAQRPECVVGSKHLCPIGWTEMPGASSIDSYSCLIDCPSPQYFKKAGVCLRTIDCPSGTHFDITQTSRSLCVDINECLPNNPCVNGGNCTNTYASYTCACPGYWAGKNCDLDNEYCATRKNPCKNKGTCQPSAILGSYTCKCLPKYAGYSCETSLASSSSSNGTIPLAAGVGGGAGLLILIIVIVVIIRRARQAEASKAHLTGAMIESAQNQSESEIDPQNLAMHEVLGQGNFGIVHRAELVVCSVSLIATIIL
jgi:hypothetical protein